MKISHAVRLAILASILLLASRTQAGLFDLLKNQGAAAAGTNAANSLAGLSADQMAGGLKEALAKGVQQAVTALGKSDGFLKDAAVKIPMPASLERVEKTLRTLRQDKLADEFVTTMNRAAERAVPEAASVLGNAVKQMTIADAQAILTATNNAATQYFRRTSETNLYARFLPIVKSATENAGVTAAYKRMTDQAGGSLGGLGAFGGKLLGVEAPDLDGYVTRKTLDGLFLKISEEEKNIRQNPVARTTDLLKQVFGAVNPPKR